MGKCNKMRRIVLHISTVMICFAVFAAISAWNQYCKKDNTGVPDAINSICAGSECRLTVSANTSCIEDKEAFAYEVIRMCRENSFQTIKLSTDVTGWPSSLDITVYLHRDDVGRKKPEMHIRFLPPDDGAEYNIKDDSAKYQLLIK